MLENPLFIKYMVGAGMLLLTLVCYSIMSFVVRKKKWTSNGMISHLVMSGLLSIAVIIIASYTKMTLIDFHLDFISLKVIEIIKLLLIGLIVILTLFYLINNLEEMQIAKGADKTSAKIITRVLKITVFLVVVLLFGEHFGLSLSGLMAFGGIGGIAIGFASKDVLSNFFSGIMLFFDRPFNIGDWINSPDRQIEGVVKEIGWRSTKIMTFQNRPLYIPNSLFSSISVENPGQMTNRRIETQIGLRYEDSAVVGVVVNDIRTMLQNNPKIDLTQTLLVYFDAFADSSLNIMVYCFTKTVKWAEWLEAQQEVYLKIIDIVHSHGADFAFPSQTLYMNNDTAPFKVEAVQAEQAMPALNSDSDAIVNSTSNITTNSTTNVASQIEAEETKSSPSPSGNVKRE